MLLFRHPILGLLGADTDTYTYASQYYTWLVLGAPFIIVALTPSNLLRTEGFAKASMIGTILGSVVNIILDPIFIPCLDSAQRVRRLLRLSEISVLIFSLSGFY